MGASERKRTSKAKVGRGKTPGGKKKSVGNGNEPLTVDKNLGVGEASMD